MLPGRSARCIAAARDLYCRILDRIEAARLRRVLDPGPGAHLRKAALVARLAVAGARPVRAPAARVVAGAGATAMAVAQLVLPLARGGGWR